MKEYTFICPHCGKAVEVDENGYAAIIKQIRDDAFQADLEEQKRVMETEREKAVELAKAQAAMEFREKEHELDSQMQNLRSDLKAAKENAETAAKLLSMKRSRNTVPFSQRKNWKLQNCMNRSAPQKQTRSWQLPKPRPKRMNASQNSRKWLPI